MKTVFLRKIDVELYLYINKYIPKAYQIFVQKQ